MRIRQSAYVYDEAADIGVSLQGSYSDIGICVGDFLNFIHGKLELFIIRILNWRGNRFRLLQTS